MASRTIFPNRPIASDGPSNAFDRWLALGILALLMTLNIGLISLKISGLPVRAVLAVGLLAVMSLLYPGAASRAFTKHRLILVLAAALAGLGVFVSLMYGTGLKDIFQAVVEVHVQTVVTLILATIVAQIAGVRPSILVIIGVIGLSAVLAALQYAGMDFAWQIRETLGNFQGQAMNEFDPFIHKRPMGLAYSPIHLATHLCLAFGAYAVLCDRDHHATYGTSKIDPAIIFALIMLAVVAFVCGTRSPILGAGIFLVLYATWRRASWLLVLLLGGGAIVYFAGTQIIEAFQATQSRVLRVDDDSAVGRLSLVKFGLLLIRDNPLGYGFTFTPSDHWMKYWRELYNLQSSDDIQSKELHNYVLNMFNTYGIGLILVLPMAATILRRVGSHLIYFVPYVVHIFFHNSGPFWNDTIIWFVVGALSTALADEDAQPRRSNPRSARRVKAVKNWVQPKPSTN